MINIDDIRAAAARIDGKVRSTPLIRVEHTLSPATPAELWLKLECLQVTGSFKARGATSKLATLDPETLRRGIVTASGGNHGLATARAGQMAGVRTIIYLPENASPAKIDKLRQWGAETRIVGRVWDESNREALAEAERLGAAYFHPFADPAVVAGQGTVALEILAERADFDLFLIAIGGGGLIAGMATAIRALRPGARIIGIEPVGAPTLARSIEAGEVVTLPQVTTGIATMACGRTDPRIYETIRDTVDEIVLIEDEAMEEAARWLWFEYGLAADLSGAASVAALRCGAVRSEPGQRICGLVCGAGPDAIHAVPAGRG